MKIAPASFHQPGRTMIQNRTNKGIPHIRTMARTVFRQAGSFSFLWQMYSAGAHSGRLATADSRKRGDRRAARRYFGFLTGLMASHFAW